MLVKASAVMAKELNKSIDYPVELVKLPINIFERLVDYESFLHDIDYSPVTCKFSVIRVSYPDDFAMPRYITTKDLTEMFNSIKEKTWEAFVDEFKREVEI